MLNRLIPTRHAAITYLATGLRSLGLSVWRLLKRVCQAITRSRTEVLCSMCVYYVCACLYIHDANPKITAAHLSFTRILEQPLKYNFLHRDINFSELAIFHFCFIFTSCRSHSRGNENLILDNFLE